MPLFISNFDNRIPQKGVIRTFLIGLTFAFLVVSFFEVGLRYRGLIPHNSDSRDLWAAQRVRASMLGSNALILVGSSRIQLGLDLEILESMLNLEVVQLAIDGSDYLPVLEDLASDDRIAGTILVSYYGDGDKKRKNGDKSTEWINYYNQKYKGLLFPSIERFLKVKVKEFSNIYSSEIPMSQLLKIFLGLEPVPKYYLFLKTDSKRERDADYSIVPHNRVYLKRAQLHLGKEIAIENYNDLPRAIELIKKEIPTINHKILGPSDFYFINDITRRLQQNGAQVIFVRFPTTGLVWEIDQARYPKERYWNQFEKYTTASTIHFNSYPELQYPLVDGSHLDQSQKKEFTRSLGEILRLEMHD